jgi:hypothetical protein
VRGAETPQTLLSIAALASFQWCFFAAVRGAGSTIAAILSAAFAPFAGDVLAAIGTRRPLATGAWSGAALLFAASSVLALTASNWSGVIAAAVSGIATAAAISRDPHADIARELAEDRPRRPRTRERATSYGLRMLASTPLAAKLPPHLSHSPQPHCSVPHWSSCLPRSRRADERVAARARDRDKTRTQHDLRVEPTRALATDRPSSPARFDPTTGFNAACATLELAWARHRSPTRQ